MKQFSFIMLGINAWIPMEAKVVVRFTCCLPAGVQTALGPYEIERTHDGPLPPRGRSRSSNDSFIIVPKISQEHIMNIQ
jgi:hypothetical protein